MTDPTRGGTRPPGAWSCALIAALTAVTAHADVACASLFTDHMVLQRDQVVPIWGTAQPGEKITVDFAGQHRAIAAKSDGTWMVKLKPLQVSADSRSLVVKGRNRLEFTDVMVGEVWFCSGQSNMEKPLGPRKGQKPTDHYEEETAAANHPLLRLFQMPHSGKMDATNASDRRWLPCTPEAMTQTQFSAAAYYFGREISQKLNMPVGLIHSSFGGTMIEAWMPADAFTSNPRLTALRSVTYASYVKGVQATELYQSMVAPLAPYAVRGFLWYQGEANCMCAEGDIYAAKMAALIDSWRAAWNEPKAPFYYVQLAPFDYSQWDKFTALETPEALPLFRDAQTSVLTRPHTGEVITTDLVTNTHDIHPTDKRDVGLRLANLALEETYKKKGVLGQSPQFTKLHKLKSGQIELTFAHAGEGLHWSAAQTADDFMIAGSDHHFVPAHAEVSVDKVIVSAPEVAEPVAVRFGWNEVAKPHLFSSAGLPVIPFRTDDWPVAAERPRPPK